MHKLSMLLTFAPFRSMSGRSPIYAACAVSAQLTPSTRSSGNGEVRSINWNRSITMSHGNHHEGNPGFSTDTTPSSAFWIPNSERVSFRQRVSRTACGRTSIDEPPLVGAHHSACGTQYLCSVQPDADSALLQSSENSFPPNSPALFFDCFLADFGYRSQQSSYKNQHTESCKPLTSTKVMQLSYRIPTFDALRNCSNTLNSTYCEDFRSTGFGIATWITAYISAFVRSGT